MGRVGLSREHPDATIGHVVIGNVSITLGAGLKAPGDILLQRRRLS
jgi:hypothetical protein